MVMRPFGKLPCFGHWSFSAVVPEIYWNVDSPEERILLLCKNFAKLCEYVERLNVNVNELYDMMKDLDDLLQAWKDGDFQDYIKDEVTKWVDTHLKFIYEHTIKQVFFGLTLDGYFVAYIPESWKEIEFDTGANYELDTYGRLILRYDTDSDSKVNQTPEMRG